ncbi:hypothetical protein [Mesobacillus thioparans]|uniref:hypothetical protein n=1 Tax=Mesobacillus thioparans TaxID=370439 RepID=UPI0039EECB61
MGILYQFIQLPVGKIEEYSFSARLVEEWKNAVYTIRKAKVPWSAPTSALEGRPVKSFFDFIGRTEATRAAQSYRFSQDTRGSTFLDENWLGAEAGQRKGSRRFYLWKTL